MSTDRAEVAVTVSGDFITHVRRLLVLTFDEMASNRSKRFGINVSSDYAFPAYISAVVSVEAFVNETFLSGMAKLATPGSALWNLPSDWLERLELWPKLTLIAQLSFGKPLPAGVQPWQDLRLLTAVRNALVHFKLKTKEPSWLTDLVRREIALPEDPLIGWALLLASSEGIRWAHNTACEAVRALIALAPPDQPYPFPNLVENFQSISDQWVREELIARGISDLGRA